MTTSSRARSGLAGLLAAATLVVPLSAAATASAAPRPTPPSPAAGPTSPAGSWLVRAEPGTLPAARAAVARLGGTVTRSLGLIDGLSADLPAGAADALRALPSVAQVTRDAAVQLAASAYDPSRDPDSLYSAGTTVKARAAFGAGLTGKGVDVALIDSGVAPVAGMRATQLVHGPDLTAESASAQTAHLDTYGHGTHLAGLINGRDEATVGKSGASLAKDRTNFLGIAPDARVVSVKVADAHGQTDVSQVIAAIDWVVQHAHTDGLNVRVLNLAFGTDSAQPYALDPLSYAAEQAWRRGLVVVVSAGNSGSRDGRLTSPATNPFLLAVGADDSRGSTSTHDDVVPAFSARGNGVRDPDLVAPGMHLQSLRVPGSYVDHHHGATGAIDQRYMRGSGTSQAAAITSGAVALLLQRYPEATPDMVKAALLSGAATLPTADAQAQGAGLLDVVEALKGLGSKAAQKHAAAKGRGSLEASRGNVHLVAADGSTLTGEQDVFGVPVDTSRLAASQATASSWSGGTWNGSAWAGSAWHGSAWAGSAWAGSAWHGSAWAGSAWHGSAWNGSAWQGSAWNGSAWQGSAWQNGSWS